jgi:hypothetical protein
MKGAILEELDTDRVAQRAKRRLSQGVESANRTVSNCAQTWVAARYWPEVCNLQP